MTSERADRLGTVVIGTVKGDIHFIGKDVVAAVLEANGFKAINLGEDVPADRFCTAVRNEKAMFVGMSCLISSSMPEMRKVIELLEKEKLRKDVKVMVGGPPISAEYAKEIGADIYAVDAFEAATKAKEAVGL